MTDLNNTQIDKVHKLTLFFVHAQVLGTWAKIPQEQMFRYTAIHVVSRAIYNYLYVVTSSRKGSYLRTIVFQVSIYPAVAIFFKSALAL